MKPRDLSQLQIYSETGSLVRTDVTFKDKFGSQHYKGKPMSDAYKNSKKLRPTAESSFVDPLVSPVRNYTVDLSSAVHSRSNSPTNMEPVVVTATAVKKDPDQSIPLPAKDQIFRLMDRWKEEVAGSSILSEKAATVLSARAKQKMISIQPKQVSSHIAVDLFNSPSYRKHQSLNTNNRPSSPVVHQGRQKVLEQEYESKLEHIGEDDWSAMISRDSGVDQRLAVRDAQFGLSKASRARMFERNMDMGKPNVLEVTLCIRNDASMASRQPSLQSDAGSQQNGRMSKRAKALVTQYEVAVESSRTQKPLSPLDSTNAAAATAIATEGFNTTSISMLDSEDDLPAVGSSFDMYPSLASDTASAVHSPTTAAAARAADAGGGAAAAGGGDGEYGAISARTDAANITRCAVAKKNKAVAATTTTTTSTAAPRLPRPASRLDSDSASKESMNDDISVNLRSINVLNDKSVFVPPEYSPEYMRSLPLSNKHLIGPAIRAASSNRKQKAEIVKDKARNLAKIAGILMPRPNSPIPLVGPKKLNLSIEKSQLYQPPEPFVTKPSHLATAKHITSYCGRCLHSEAEVLCEKCNMLFCMKCWAMIPHHRFNDIAPMMKVKTGIGGEVNAAVSVVNSKLDSEETNLFITAAKSSNKLQEMSISTMDQLSSSLRELDHASAVIDPLAVIQSNPLAMTDDIDAFTTRRSGKSTLPDSEEEAVQALQPSIESIQLDSDSAIIEQEQTVSRGSSPIERGNSPIERENSPIDMITPQLTKFSGKDSNKHTPVDATTNNTNTNELGLGRPPPRMGGSPFPTSVAPRTAQGQLLPISNEHFFVGENGSVMPRLKDSYRSSKSAQGFSGFSSPAKSTASVSGAFSIGTASNLAISNEVSDWAELNLLRYSNVSEEELLTLSPTKRAIVRQSEVDRIGSVAVAAAETIRLAKKHNDRNLLSHQNSFDSRKKREQKRKGLMEGMKLSSL